jgi:GDP-L-fucose synthase
MRLLITGARGMVGSNLVAGLAGEHDVVGLGRSELDLLDAAATEATLRRVQPDIVVHAAGRVGGIAANARANALFLRENTVMGLNLLEAARSTGITRVLNLGSSCIYPRDREGSLTEADLLTGPLEPTNEGYAVAKIAVLKYAAMLRAEDPRCDFKTVIPCNLYGPGDHFTPESSHMIPAAIHKIENARQRGDDEVDIWGDGQARREFMYVGDLVDFVAEAVRRWETLPELINVGLGRDHSIDDYYLEIAALIGWHGTFRHDLSRPVGMRRKLLDVEAARNWGWEARTSLAEGLRHTYEHYRTVMA